jgi:hypothetical protein
VADPAVGDSATATPGDSFFHFFSAKSVKKEVTLPWICLKTGFWPWLLLPHWFFWIHHWRKLIYWLQGLPDNGFVRTRLNICYRNADFVQWKMIIFLRSVEKNIHIFGRLYDPLLFVHRGSPVCYYRIPSYSISSKYHQAVVNINLCQTDTLVSGEIRSHGSILRSFMDK